MLEWLLDSIVKLSFFVCSCLRSCFRTLVGFPVRGSISGQILKDLSQLQVLLLVNGDFQSRIPSEIGLLTRLVQLGISRSPGVVGTVPASISALTNLQQLFLEGNSLVGAVPRINAPFLGTSSPIACQLQWTMWPGNCLDLRNSPNCYANGGRCVCDEAAATRSLCARKLNDADYFISF
jgi:hypothetical protein